VKKIHCLLLELAMRRKAWHMGDILSDSLHVYILMSTEQIDDGVVYDIRK
jgi:hypothetical protein